MSWLTIAMETVYPRAFWRGPQSLGAPWEWDVTTDVAGLVGRQERNNPAGNPRRQ